MKVSLNWIKKFTEVELPIDELVEKIGAQLGAVDEVVDLGNSYKGIVVVEVLSCQKHPDADKLSVCIVDDRGAVQGVQRQPDGHVQIVCGAPNVHEGMLAVWVPPSVVVPATANKDPFKIEAKEIRGIISNGMLASPKELAMGDNHEGLLVVEGEVEPGTSFAEVYGLNDQVIDIENKMFTHRPDLFGMLGIAREIAGIQGKPFTSPGWYNTDIQINGGSGLQLELKNEVPELVPRFCLLTVKDVKVGPSSASIQSALTSVGIRPINNIVDITNYLMMETAQPLHAYDYDKVKTAKLGVRLSKNGEQLKLLGGKELKLKEGSVVITDGEKPIGLGGVMGGVETEVDEGTKNIILECGTFDMNATRRSAMTYGLFTDAATRFTKGQSALQNVAVIAKAAEKVVEIAGGQVAGQLIDDHKPSSSVAAVNTTPEFINNRLGLELSPSEIADLLKNVEIEVTIDEELTIQPPFWRTDIVIAEDIVEEVGRLYGYDHLPVVLPPRDLAAAERNPFLDFKNQIRDHLSSAGANEVLTYSFVHGSLLSKAGQPAELAYQLRNALSPDLQYYRLSLMPSLLDKVHPNIKLGHQRFALYEIGLGHNKKYPEVNGEKVPAEFNMLAFVVASSTKSSSVQSGSAFYGARAFLDYLASRLGVTFSYESLNEAPDYPVAKPYDHNRSAAVSIAGTAQGIGMIGEFRPEVSANLKLPPYCAGFEIGLEELFAGLPKQPSYINMPRFPRVQQDLTVKVPGSVSFAKLSESLVNTLEELKPRNSLTSLTPVSIYQKDPDTKNHTFHLSIASYDKTLKAEEINRLLDGLAERTHKEFGGQRV